MEDGFWTIRLKLRAKRNVEGGENTREKTWQSSRLKTNESSNKGEIEKKNSKLGNNSGNEAITSRNHTTRNIWFDGL
jgi:hypothetical protein